MTNNNLDGITSNPTVAPGIETNAATRSTGPFLFKPVVLHPPRATTQREFMDFVLEHYGSNLPETSSKGRAYDEAYWRAMMEKHMKIKERYFVRELDSMAKPLSPQEQADMFLEKGMELGIAAIKQVLRETGVECNEVDKMFFTSHLPLVFPSLAHHIMSNEADDPEMNFHQDCKLWSSHNYGCAGGGVVLEEAREWLAQNPDKTALVLCAELSSIGFRPGNGGMSWAVNSGLFGDAVAAMVLQGEDRFRSRQLGLQRLSAGRIRTPAYQDGCVSESDTESCKSQEATPKVVQLLSGGMRVVRKSTKAMYYTYKPEGYTFTVVPSVTKAVSNHAPNFAAHLTREAFGADVTPADLRVVILHPGGAKIVSNCYPPLGLEGSPSEAVAYETLKYGGNRASCLVVDMLQKWWEKANHGDEGVLVGIGPGVTLAGVCLRFVDSATLTERSLDQLYLNARSAAVAAMSARRVR